jgi:hypothetical protein
MVTDEKLVTKTPQSSTGFVNTWIKQAELTGRVGRVEPEVDEELPVSYAQIKQTLMELLTLGNEELSNWIMHPNNAGIAAKAVGIPLYIPGADARDKQMSEIGEMLQGNPLAEGISSVQINPLTDQHEIEAETLLVFLNSATGQAQKRINPAGIQNCEFHYMAHIMEIANKQQQQVNEQTEMQAQEANAGEQPPPV